MKIQSDLNITQSTSEVISMEFIIVHGLKCKTNIEFEMKNKSNTYVIIEVQDNYYHWYWNGSIKLLTIAK